MLNRRRTRVRPAEDARAARFLDHGGAIASLMLDASLRYRVGPWPRAATAWNPMTVLKTPDLRYIVVRGRLWRASNPALDDATRAASTHQLMDARREVAAARRTGDADRLVRARAAVDAAKVALGERGAVWWHDGAPDFNRKLARNTPYADWYERARREGEGAD